MNWLIGKSGYSLLDVSTIVHFCFWVVMGSNVYYLKLPRGKALLGMLALAALWELFERYAEKKWPDIWLHQESWWNAWVSDMVTVPLGCYFVWALFDRYW